MATENALMAAALTPGMTMIRNAASEPHVQDLARMLVAMGAEIEGIGSNVMIVHGRAHLHGCTHTIAPDHIEIGSFMALAGVTGGELVVKDTVPEDLRMIRLVFERLGLHSEIGGSDVVVPGEPATDDPKRRRRAIRRRSRTGRGRPSRPTSPASRWRLPPRPTAR